MFHTWSNLQVSLCTDRQWRWMPCFPCSCPRPFEFSAKIFHGSCRSLCSGCDLTDNRCGFPSSPSADLLEVMNSRPLEVCKPTVKTTVCASTMCNTNMLWCCYLHQWFLIVESSCEKLSWAEVFLLQYRSIRFLNRLTISQVPTLYLKSADSLAFLALRAVPGSNSHQRVTLF